MKRILVLALCLCMTVSALSACNVLNSEVSTGSDNTEPVGTQPSGDGNGQLNEPSTVVKDNVYYDTLNKRAEVLEPLDNDFRSRTEVSYSGINGKDVTLYTLYREVNEGMNNPNFAQAVMLYQCVKYKIAHPEEHVVATLSTFHLSVYAAACLDPQSEEYGRMENLYDKEYDEETGYYRVSWLLVDAARHGVEVLVIGDLDASGVYMSDGSYVPDADFLQYFNSWLDQDALVENKKIGDFLTVRRAEWTDYGDKAASDMMHLKLCTVSHRIANDGTEKGPAVWVGSINLDGVNDQGINQHNSIQTGVVITEHEELRRVMYNFMSLLKNYCGQEEVTAFRRLVISRVTEQTALIQMGMEDQIPSDQKIVYMGSDQDSVFEFYFTPFGGNQNQWDTIHNPYCRYLGKLLTNATGSDSIQLVWNNVKFVQTFGLANTFSKVIANAFRNNQHPDDILILQLPGLDVNIFADLPTNDQFRINENGLIYHIKDLQLSYVENGERNWVVLYNTLNMHEGSMAYQTNLMLVVKENEKTGNHFYTDYAILTTPGADFESYRVWAKSE